MSVTWPLFLTRRLGLFVLLSGLAVSFLGCSSDAPQNDDPASLARNYWDAMAQGDANAANSYTLPGALATWQMGTGFSLLHVGEVHAEGEAMLVPVVVRLLDGKEQDITTVLTFAEGDYWVDVEATLARSWRPEAAQLEKALLSEDGFEPDAGDGEVR